MGKASAGLPNRLCTVLPPVSKVPTNKRKGPASPKHTDIRTNMAPKYPGSQPRRPDKIVVM